MSIHQPNTADAGRALVQTRLPSPLRSYLRAYAKHHDLKLEALMADILGHFLHLRPDQHGLSWRKPQSNRSEAGSSAGWAQFNSLVPEELAGKLAGAAMGAGISRASLVYTAVYWFARYMRPPTDSMVIQDDKGVGGHD